MKVTRLFTNEDGESVFSDMDIELKSAGPIGRLSAETPVKSLVFRETDGDYDYDFHNAPARQLIVMLDSAIEIETSLGVCRRFSGGDLLLVEDTTGKGHRTKSIAGNLRRSLFIVLEEDNGTF